MPLALFLWMQTALAASLPIPFAAVTSVRVRQVASVWLRSVARSSTSALLREFPLPVSMAAI